MSETVPVVRLRQFLVDSFRAAGAAEDDVQAGTQAFLIQEMRGVQTHALRRLRGIVDRLADGPINAKPNRAVLNEDRGGLVLDGDRGLGITSATRGMEEAMRLARTHGLGMAIVVNTNHFLAAAPYCLRASDEGFVGITLASIGNAMAYPGTHAGAIGIAPVGFAAPGADFPIVFDAALTTSHGKMNRWERTGKPIEEALAGYDADGNPTTDPAAILHGGVPLPMGLQKGAGLSVLVDVLTGILAGQSFLRNLQPEGHNVWRRRGRVVHGFLAIDVEAFAPVADFRERLATYIADLKANPLAPESDEILAPGERAARSVERCMREGVTLEDDVVERMRDLAEHYGVELPFAAV